MLMTIMHLLTLLLQWQISIKGKPSKRLRIQLLLTNGRMSRRLLLLLVVLRLDGHASKRIVKIRRRHIQCLGTDAPHGRAIEGWTRAVPPSTNDTITRRIALMLTISILTTNIATTPTILVELPPTLTRPYRRGNLPSPQRLEINPPIKKLVPHRTPQPHHTQPQPRLPLQQPRNASPTMRRKMHLLRKNQRSAPQPPKQLGPIRSIPRRKPRHHLVQNHPQPPVIHAEPVSPLVQHLRRHVLGRPARGLGAPGGMGDAVLGQSEIAELDVAVGVEENVFGFEIAVDDAVFVEVADGEEEFGGVEAGDWFLEAAIPAQVEKQFASGTVV
mmetsp:Transcript_35453/g.63887  ORF Transcript_35453/g.63887 Transcript_35453/m.63887 type:complete len:329 (-) Transcript_35453:697-1683(-)